MIRAWPLVLLFSLCVLADGPVREMTYPGAVPAGGQIVPLFDKGYLLFLHPPNRLEVFRPDGKLAFNTSLPCPGTGDCSAGAIAVDSRGYTAVGFGYMTREGRAAGIRILDPQGTEVRFLETGGYVPTSLCFDQQGQLWSLGWQRDPNNVDFEWKEDYPLVRKFTGDGKEIGRYVPRSGWPGKKAQPARGGRGYWRMYAASDRVGAVIHESHADNPAEWIEWDLSGRLLSRTAMPGRAPGGRAYTADGRLYGRFRVAGSGHAELRVLDRATGNWLPVRTNLPEGTEREGVFLLGAQGSDLVYRVGTSRLVWVRPGDR